MLNAATLLGALLAGALSPPALAQEEEAAPSPSPLEYSLAEKSTQSEYFETYPLMYPPNKSTESSNNDIVRGPRTN